MEIRIKSIHFDVSERLEAFVQKKVSKLVRFSDDIMSAEVVLKVVKPESSNNKSVAISLKVKKTDFFAEKVNDTFEESVDDCVEILERQIVKYKEKVRDK